MEWFDAFLWVENPEEVYDSPLILNLRNKEVADEEEINLIGYDVKPLLLRALEAILDEIWLTTGERQLYIKRMSSLTDVAVRRDTQV